MATGLKFSMEKIFSVSPKLLLLRSISDVLRFIIFENVYSTTDQQQIVFRNFRTKVFSSKK